MRDLGFLMLGAGLVAILWASSGFVLPDRFKASVFYMTELRMTEIVLEDCATVWHPWTTLPGHCVDLGYAMSDGHLVAVRIWDDVRTVPKRAHGVSPYAPTLEQMRAGLRITRQMTDSG